VFEDKGTRWPELTLDGWQDTYATLHLWSQIVGKITLAHADPINHSWGVAFHLTPRGLTTQLLRQGPRSFTIELDFIEHRLIARISDGEVRSLSLEPRSVADFHRALMGLMREMGIPVRIWPVAVELAWPIRLDEDVEHASYDPEVARRLWAAFSSVAAVLRDVRCTYLGKCSPVHFFWGGFDLAFSRFSGRAAPPREGPAFMREAYSHEVISHGFWPGYWGGGGPVQEPAFYAYAAPVPAALRDARVRPAEAYYHRDMDEFILPYEAVRTARSPERVLREFVDSTWEAAAAVTGWDRAALERPAI
jgi:hypothetical protein